MLLLIIFCSAREHLNSVAALLSPHYNTAIKDLFFDQCFEIVCKLGVGSFGEVCLELFIFVY